MLNSLSRYLPYHAGGLWFDDLYSVRSAATRGVVLQLPLLDKDFDTSKSKIAFDEVLRTRRYFDGDFYVLTEPTVAANVWAGYQCHLPQSNEGMVRLFRRKDNAESEKTFVLNGIDQTLTYELTIYDEYAAKQTVTVSGETLANGYAFEIPSPRASLCAEYAPVKA
jgi:hypothetical protein